MNLLNEALNIAVIGLVAVLAVLMILMWTVMLIERIIGKRDKSTKAPSAQSKPQGEPTARADARNLGSPSSEETAAIMATVRAAYRDFPWGGRVRIEEVPRQRQ